MVSSRTRWLVSWLGLGLALAPLTTAPVLAAPAADAASTLIVLDTPRGGTTGTQLYVAGWAADPGSSTGTGVDRVEVYLDSERDAGGSLLGRATYGLARPDVGTHLGSSRFALSGFALQANVPPGPHTVYVYAHPSDQPADQGWATPKSAALQAVVGGGSAGPPSASTFTLRRPGISGSYAYELPTGSNYPPGPADIGGSIYAPMYYGYGLYGGVQPFPDYPQYYASSFVPNSFDFSYGAGYDFYSPGFLARPRYLPLGPSFLPSPYLGFPWASTGPVYCPAFTYVFC